MAGSERETIRVRDVVRLLDELYPRRFAESWDRVGTIAGDLDNQVRSVLFAVDPVQVVAEEAVALGVDMVVTHHPLFLRGTSFVATDSAKGRVVHSLVNAGIALHNCHTNADSPRFGVSEALAQTIGLQGIRPLVPDSEALDKWVTFVPVMQANAVVSAMHRAGAGHVGNYDQAVFASVGQGSFRPLTGADPALGHVGAVERVEEKRIEMVADRGLRQQIREALVAAHPYETPAYDVWPLADTDSVDRGTGRIGDLAVPMTLHDFAQHVATVLPEHHGAIRVAGDPRRQVQRVALVGGAGDAYLDAAQASGAGVYLTSDLRHHPASEHLEHAEATALIDVPHWAAEWTWLPVVADIVHERLGLSTTVSTLVTDPWSMVI
jgi:dinuclear metal center YbgI/SA1388 family protein